jgi:hypothetical protein
MKKPTHRPLPDMVINNIGMSDEEFHLWLHKELETAPCREKYSTVFEMSIDAIVNWRKRYRGNPKLWKRIFKKDRVLKELIESAPIIYAVMTYLQSDHPDKSKEVDEKITILDLCSGKGYLSMFLSEILPPEKVNKIILIDKAWAMCNTELQPHHINWDHIYGKVPTFPENEGDDDDNDDEGHHERYFTTWPIPLHTSKQDLKQSCNRRQMKKHFFDRIEGPIVILAVHLCGTLSLKAVDMFNNHENVSLFALKPCCLPTMVYAQRGDVFKLGKHEFKAEEVCSNGSFNKKDWSGPPRWHLEGKFDKWTDNLYQGIDVLDHEQMDNHHENSLVEVGKKVKENIGKMIMKEYFVKLFFVVFVVFVDITIHFICWSFSVVQVDGGFQNKYIFAQRSPLTRELWI